MRVARLVCAMALAGCGERAPLVVSDASPTLTPPDAGAAEMPPAPGTIDSVFPTGTADPSGGSTSVAVLAALDDGGVIAGGVFSGTVAFAPDKVLTAQSARNAYVARYRRDQRLVWVAPLLVPSGEVVVSGLASLPGGEVAVGGWFASTLTIGIAPPGGRAPTLTSSGGLDAFVARLAADGSVRWAVSAGGTGDDIIRGLAALPTYVGPDGATLPAAVYAAAVVGPDAVFGRGEKGETAVTLGEGPLALASFDADSGALAWARFAGGGVPAQAYAIAADSVHRAVLMGGYVNGPVTFKGASAAYTVDPAIGRAYVAQWSGAGVLSWARGMAGAMGETDSLTVTPDGDPVVAGTFEGDASFGVATLHADAPGQPACFLTRLAHGDGSVTWASRLTSIGLRPWRVRAMRSGDLLVAASFGGTVIVDPNEMRPARITSAGDDDPVFMRLAGSGPLLEWATTGGGPGDDEASDVVEAADGFVWAGGRYVGPATFPATAGLVTLGSGTDGAGFILRLWP